MSLSKAFWGLGVVGTIIFLVAFRSISGHLGPWFTLAMFILWAIFASVAIWRNAKTNSKVGTWGVLARICVILFWIVSASILGFGYWAYRPDFGSNSSNVMSSVEYDPALPYIGFWKTDCNENFGLVIEKATETDYYIRFCGPGGCFGKSPLMKSSLTQDPRYKIFDQNTIGVSNPSKMDKLSEQEVSVVQKNMRDGMVAFKRCQ